MKIPADLRESFPDKPGGEFAFSLQTRDLSVANKLAIEHATRLEAEFAELRAAKQPRGITYFKSANAESLTKLLSDYVRAVVLNIDEVGRRQGVASGDIVRALLAVDGRLALMIHGDTQENVYAAWRGYVSRTLERASKGYSYGDNSEIDVLLDGSLRLFNIVVANREADDYQRLRRAFLTAYLEGVRAQQRRNDGMVVAAPSIPEELFDIGRSTPTLLSGNAQGGPSIDDIFESWERQRGSNSSTANAVKAAVQEFKASAGKSAAGAVTKADAVAFKDSQLTKVSAATTLKKLGFLKAVFTLAEADSRVATNPFNGVKVTQEKFKSKGRVGFAAQDIALIFGQPLFTDRILPAGRQAGGQAAYWLPLIALFTGARLEEIGQLLVSDIKTREGIAYLDINNEGDKSVKNAPSIREVPLHSTLLRLGLMDYFSSLPKRGRAFPELYEANDGTLTKNFSKWFGRWKCGIGIVDERKTFHSFRHGFATACRLAGVVTGVHYGITGHSDGTVGGTYGEVPLRAKADAIAKLSFDGFEL